MTGPIDRLRAADPGAALGPQPDERAEADLRVLLAEPQPAGASAPHRERRRLAPVLVTAVVALAVIALTAAVLGFVHPRTDVGGTSTPTLGPSDCHPAEVLPFECGTYESTYGGKAITGDLGGPAKDRLRISFTPKDGALLLTASTIDCFAETVMVRYDGTRLIRIGTPEYSENDCNGPGADKKSWAYAFLNGPLELGGDVSVDGPDFGSGASSVFFEYLGAAPIGAQQSPRNDDGCVAAHVQPFSCSDAVSAAGSGTVEFLGSNRYKLFFRHGNGQLTAVLDGACNTLSFVFEPDGNTLVAIPAGSTLVGCFGDRAQHDAASRRSSPAS